VKVIRRITVFDASDIDAESRFWAGLLGGDVHRDDDWHSIVVDGEWAIGVQLAPNHVRPDWPTGPQQEHACCIVNRFDRRGNLLECQRGGILCRH
jgi:hypothetical protein